MSVGGAVLSLKVIFNDNRGSHHSSSSYSLRPIASSPVPYSKPVESSIKQETFFKTLNLHGCDPWWWDRNARSTDFHLGDAFFLNLSVDESQNLILFGVGRAKEAIGNSAWFSASTLQMEDGPTSSKVILGMCGVSISLFEGLGGCNIVRHEIQVKASEAASEKQCEEGKQNNDEVHSNGAREGAAQRGGIGVVRKLLAKVGSGPMDGKNRSSDSDGLCDRSNGYESKIGSVVAQANVIAEPGAVMVKPADAVVASGAMASSWWSPYSASVAKLDCDGPAAKHEPALSDGGEGCK